MLNLEVRIDIPSEVLHLSRELQSPINEIHDAAAQYLSDSYKFYVAAVGAVDTGDLITSIHVEEGPSGGVLHQKYVVAGVPYAIVVETGWTERGQGQASYPGRFPAQKAIESFLDAMKSGEIVDALQWRLGK